MNEKEQRKISKRLSLVLRHSPETIGIELDEQGWVDVDLLLEKMAANSWRINQQQLEIVVAENDKKRFAFNVDHTMIRANQGHSVSIELGYEPSEPPEFLYHGSVPKFLDSIKQSGLEKRSRHDVHLSESIQTATKVGQRRGEAVILTIHSGKMHRDGFEFRLTPNQVWLTTEVPPKYIDFPE